jgi:hypothetical protein
VADHRFTRQRDRRAGRRAVHTMSTVAASKKATRPGPSGAIPYRRCPSISTTMRTACQNG